MSADAATIVREHEAAQERLRAAQATVAAEAAQERHNAQRAALLARIESQQARYDELKTQFDAAEATIASMSETWEAAWAAARGAAALMGTIELDLLNERAKLRDFDARR